MVELCAPLLELHGIEGRGRGRQGGVWFALVALTQLHWYSLEDDMAKLIAESLPQSPRALSALLAEAHWDLGSLA